MIYRIDVLPAQTATNVDHSGESVRHQIAEFGIQVGKVSTRRAFLIDTDASLQQIKAIAAKLIADPVVESTEVIQTPSADAGQSRIEVHFKPGVMDPRRRLNRDGNPRYGPASEGSPHRSGLPL